MFTGIVEEVGRVTAVTPRDNGVQLDVQAERVTGDLRPGSSIAVQGVCLTVLDTTPRSFRAAAEQETLRVTTLGQLATGALVNLERALSAGGRFDGHLVLGHVDGTARVAAVRTEGRTRVLEIDIPEALAPFVVPKGSIAVDGVSLTVGPHLRGGRIELFLIPYTWDQTALGALGVGDLVNVETDIVGRYVAHLLSRAGEPGSGGLTWEALERAFGEERP